MQLKYSFLGQGDLLRRQATTLLMLDEFLVMLLNIWIICLFALFLFVNRTYDALLSCLLFFNFVKKGLLRNHNRLVSDIVAAHFVDLQDVHDGVIASVGLFEYLLWQLFLGRLFSSIRVLLIA